MKFILELFLLQGAQNNVQIGSLFELIESIQNKNSYEFYLLLKFLKAQMAQNKAQIQTLGNQKEK